MKQLCKVREITCNFWITKIQRYNPLKTQKFGVILNIFLGGLMILLLEGCQSMPKDPKKPDPSPRVPINKTIPPEIQESIYENPTR